MSKVCLVFLDDGHGMGTPGKRTPYITELGRHIKENEFNKAVVDILKGELKRADIHVVLVAPYDDDVPLKERTDYANKIYWSYCSEYGKENVQAIYVSIHYNAFDGKFDNNDPEGFSVHIYKGHRNKAAGKLANCILSELKNGTVQINRGIKENDFHVLRETVMPAILTENGFMDNKREAMLMLDENFQKEVAIEHAKGICNYFGIKYISESEDGTLKLENWQWVMLEKELEKHSSLDKRWLEKAKKRELTISELAWLNTVLLGRYA